MSISSSADKRRGNGTMAQSRTFLLATHIAGHLDQAVEKFMPACLVGLLAVALMRCHYWMKESASVGSWPA